MDFEFSEAQLAFLEEVRVFLDAADDPDVFDPTRENMAQIVDTPKRRALMKQLGEQGWLGMTWPEEYGGQEGEGVYEYLLNEELAGRGGPQIGKGVGIIGKTLIAHGSEILKEEFLPKILTNDVEFDRVRVTLTRRGTETEEHLTARLVYKTLLTLEQCPEGLNEWSQSLLVIEEGAVRATNKVPSETDR